LSKKYADILQQNSVTKASCLRAKKNENQSLPFVGESPVKSLLTPEIESKQKPKTKDSETRREIVGK
jgi:hypothetical protein